MILRLLFPLFLFFPLFGAENPSQSKADFKVEAGIFITETAGTITNNVNKSNFTDDFGYERANASYFAMGVTFQYDYVPNIYINYFSMRNNEDVTLDRSVRVANGDFNTTTASSVDYQVLNATLYQDFKIKGDYLSFLGYNFYSGDLEYDVGINAKFIEWHFRIKSSTPAGLLEPLSFIRVYEFVPLPYLGFRYYIYNLALYADISALAIGRVKSTNYTAGIDYEVYNGLYLSAGYVFENFKVVEKLDTVEFGVSGYKISFKYTF